MRYVLAALVLAAGVTACGSLQGSPSTSDTAGVPDAGAAEAAAGAGTFCSAHPGVTQCTDFDEAGDPYAGWGASVFDSGTIHEIVPSHAASSPNALRVMLDSSVKGVVDASRLSRSIPGGPSTVRTRVSFSIYLASASYTVGGGLSIGELYCGDGVTVNEGIYLERNENEAVVATLGDGSGTPVGTLAAGDRADVVIDVDWAHTPPIATVDFAGARHTVSLPRSCTSIPGFVVNVGLATYEGVDGEAYYDDILFEVNPP